MDLSFTVRFATMYEDTRSRTHGKLPRVEAVAARSGQRLGNLLRPNSVSVVASQSDVIRMGNIEIRQVEGQVRSYPISFGSEALLHFYLLSHYPLRLCMSINLCRLRLFSSEALKQVIIHQ